MEGREIARGLLEDAFGEIPLGDVLPVNMAVPTLLGLLCSSVFAENDSLSENYYRIKEDHTGLREKYSDTRRRFYDEQKLRMEVEQNHDSIVRSWKLQLDQKAQDFMELQQNMAPPRDLDLLRIKIQEELEAPHQEIVSRLE